MKVFLFPQIASSRSGLSITTRSRNIFAKLLKDQCMAKNRCPFLAFCFAAGILALLFICPPLRAATFTEDFSSDPMQNGWKTFGDTNLFQWDSTNQDLAVTWNSSQTNSYFYHPLGTIVARDDDFTIDFDIFLNDIMSGNEPGKTSPLSIGIGFFNFAGATSTNFGRGIYGGAANLAEFSYFPTGYYDLGNVLFPSFPTTTPTFISSSGFAYAPTTFSPYVLELPTNQWIHVAMSYTAANQTMTMVLTTNGALLTHLPDVVLTDTNSSQFGASNDIRVDTFSINSYSSAGDDFDSVLAHGFVRNIAVTVPPPPVQNLAGAVRNGAWQVQFNDLTNWLYTLQSSADLSTWSDISDAVPGVDTALSIIDTNALTDKAFYRVRATRPPE
jgi:hypothetical protein